MILRTRVIDRHGRLTRVLCFIPAVGLNPTMVHDSTRQFVQFTSFTNYSPRNRFVVGYLHRNKILTVSMVDILVSQ